MECLTDARLASMDTVVWKLSDCFTYTLTMGCSSVDTLSMILVSGTLNILNLKNIFGGFFDF